MARRTERLVLSAVAVRTRNELDRMHWSRRARYLGDLRWVVRQAWARRSRFEEPVKIRMRFYRARLVDADNLDCKHVLDAMKGIVFPDDSPRWIPERPELTQANDRYAPRVEIVVEAVAQESGEGEKSPLARS